MITIIVIGGVVVLWFAFEVWRAPLVPDDHPWVKADQNLKRREHS